VPEHPTDDDEVAPFAAPEAPAGNLDSETALLQMDPGAGGRPSSLTMGAAGNKMLHMEMPGIDEMLYVDPSADFSAQAAALPGRAAPGSSRTRSQFKRLSWGFWVAVGWVVFIVVLAILAPILPLQSYSDPSQSCLNTLPGAGPGVGHWLGCDSGSRDVLSRVIWGTRVSLIVGFCSIAMGLLVGGILGLIAGYFRGMFDEGMGVLANTFLSFPYLVLGLAIISFLGNSLWDVVLIIAILAWPLLFRVVRASTIEYGERDYIIASRALGSTRWRVLLKQLLPDVVPSAVTYGLIGVAVAIVAEGALSFLGQSVADPTVTWGKMIAEGSVNLNENVAQLLAPAIAMFLTILAVNFMGEKLRSILDAREAVL